MTTMTLNQPQVGPLPCKCSLSPYHSAEKRLWVTISAPVWAEILGAAGGSGLSAAEWLGQFAFRALPFGTAGNRFARSEPVKISRWDIRVHRNGEATLFVTLHEYQWALIMQAAARLGMKPDAWLEQHGMAGIMPQELPELPGSLSGLN